MTEINNVGRYPSLHSPRDIHLIYMGMGLWVCSKKFHAALSQMSIVSNLENEFSKLDEFDQINHFALKPITGQIPNKLNCSSAVDLSSHGAQLYNMYIF